MLTYVFFILCCLSFESVMLANVQAVRRTLRATYLHSVWVLELNSQQGAVPFTITQLSFCSHELHHTPVCVCMIGFGRTQWMSLKLCLCGCLYSTAFYSSSFLMFCRHFYSKYTYILWAKYLKKTK